MVKQKLLLFLLTSNLTGERVPLRSKDSPETDHITFYNIFADRRSAVTPPKAQRSTSGKQISRPSKKQRSGLGKSQGSGLSKAQPSQSDKGRKSLREISDPPHTTERPMDTVAQFGRDLIRGLPILVKGLERFHGEREDNGQSIRHRDVARIWIYKWMSSLRVAITYWKDHEPPEAEDALNTLGRALDEFKNLGIATNDNIGQWSYLWRIAIYLSYPTARRLAAHGNCEGTNPIDRTVYPIYARLAREIGDAINFHRGRNRRLEGHQELQEFMSLPVEEVRHLQSSKEDKARVQAWLDAVVKISSGSSSSGISAA